MILQNPYQLPWCLIPFYNRWKKKILVITIALCVTYMKPNINRLTKIIARAKQMRRGHMRHVRRNCGVGGDRQRFGHNYRIQGQFSKCICWAGLVARQSKRLTSHRAIEPLRNIPSSFFKHSRDWRAVEQPSHSVMFLPRSLNTQATESSSHRVYAVRRSVIEGKKTKKSRRRK